MVAAALMAAGAGVAQDTDDTGAAAGIVLGCTVSGHDVVLTNTTEAAIPAGTLLTWSVPFVRMEVTAVTEDDLPPRRTFFMTSVLGANYLRGTTPCDGAAVLSDPEAPGAATLPDSG
jgi:hypothetical protein